MRINNPLQKNIYIYKKYKMESSSSEDDLLSCLFLKGNIGSIQF